MYGHLPTINPSKDLWYSCCGLQLIGKTLVVMSGERGGGINVQADGQSIPKQYMSFLIKYIEIFSIEKHLLEHKAGFLTVGMS